MIAFARRASAAVVGLIVAAAFALGGPEPARAQAPPDTSVTASPSSARRARAALGRDTQRFEIGAAIADAPFDALGTIAYHRYVRAGGPFENWIHVELAGGRTTYLDEGAASAAFLVRPLLFIRRQGSIQPILEAGPAGHLVVQVAEVQDFGETVFHAHAYLKGHAYAGFDLHLGGGWGIVARGRFTVPAHRPFDYAQIAVFFR